MIGLDTNVLLAWVLSGQARQLPPVDHYRVSHVVLAELVWVLARTMKYSRSALSEVIQGLLGASDIVIDRVDVVSIAFEDFRKGGADFADALIARENEAAGCRTTLTLDRKAAHQPGFTLLKNTGA